VTSPQSSPAPLPAAAVMGPLGDDELLTVHLADLKHRQEEINERTRAENGQFVLFATILAAIVGATALLSSRAATLPMELNQLLPTIVIVAAALLSFLPLSVAHHAFATETRRVYVQLVVEPRIQALFGTRVMGFEEYDRDQHRGWPNATIGGRAAVVCSPPVLLFVAYVLLRVVNGWPSELTFLIFDALAIIGLAGISLVTIKTMLATVGLVRRMQPKATPEPEPTTTATAP
jgi:hypothetical protein